VILSNGKRTGNEQACIVFDRGHLFVGLFSLIRLFTSHFTEEPEPGFQIITVTFQPDLVENALPATTMLA
jgi:hypothetical protein